MRNNSARDRLGQRTGQIVVVEPSRQMQHLLRAMFSTHGIRDVRIFGDSERAANAMLTEPPAAVLFDWNSEPYSGEDFLKLFRHQNMFPVCLVPIIVMFAEARQPAIEKAMRLGAQAALVKPLSSEVLLRHLKWVLSGGSPLKLKGDRYIVDGVEARLKDERERQAQLKAARQYQESQFAEMAAIQKDVDRILGGEGSQFAISRDEFLS